ncbi:hypothetical protein PBI_SCTP2_1 [Salicola phage SCTP-2]|nr:hypothetical protein PBI_SCTP2_1 [Salicola phage SCTP-2]
MTETIISPYVFEYDKRLALWNELITNNIQNDMTQKTINDIIEWWNNYPVNTRKQRIYTFNDKPNTVWDILEKYKISKLEKIFGIYYTIECLCYYHKLNYDLSLSEIQKQDGDYDLVIIINGNIVNDNHVMDGNEIQNCSFLNTMNDKYYFPQVS